MAIQKFKFGQEITSSKLNEIVTFVNNLEGFLQSSQYWNQNVDSKIAVFQTQLNNIVNQVKGLLDSSESFETLLTAFIDLKAKYESLVTENVQVLLENIFNPSNISVNEDGLFVINGITTGVQLTTLVGPQGESLTFRCSVSGACSSCRSISEGAHSKKSWRCAKNERAQRPHGSR
jgi:ferredoxin